MRADTDAHELPDLGRQLSDYSTSPSLNNQGILQGTLRGLSPSKVASNVLSSLKPDLFRARKPVLRPVPTAWLDGLRGVAAFVVCVSHLTGYVYFNTGLCYGHETDPGQIYRSPIGLPFIRILFSGQYYAVVLFFMISGYVLTKRLIALLHQGRREEFLEALNSSVCRRPGRLWLPVIWSTFALAVFWHATGIVTPFPPREPTFIKELWNWKRETLTFMDPFRAGFMLWTNFNYHTWTIPVELRGSMLLYVWLFATSQFSARTRVLLTLVVLWYYVYGIDGVFYASFFAGYIIAECDLIYAENIGSIAKLPWDGLIQALRRRPKLKQIVLHGLLITGLFLSGQPYTQFHDREVVMNQCGVWSILNKMIPVAYEIPEWAPPLLRGMTPLSWRWFWFFWAAWLTVFSCNNINWVKKLFESAPAQCNLSVSPSS